MRKIIHIDQDAFYASVEQRDNPTLLGKAIAVGGSPGGRGVVMTASYEARKFGVRSAMPAMTAARLCPNLIFVRPRMEAYKIASQEIREIFYQYTVLVEPLSLDEAFLDVTINKLDIASAIQIAREIKSAIVEKTGLTATAGVSYNKFLAKMASGQNKPNGLNFIPPEKAQDFIDGLPIHKFHGIGEKTAERMRGLGIHNGADLRKQEAPFLKRHFGKMGTFYFQIAQGIDERLVTPDRPTRSVSVEDTFQEDVDDLLILDQEIERLSNLLGKRLKANGLLGRTITLKVKYADFQQITRSTSQQGSFVLESDMAEKCMLLLRKTDAETKKVRLIGIGVSNFDAETEENDSHGQLRFDFEV